jgi:hypothetical protein
MKKNVIGVLTAVFLSIAQFGYAGPVEFAVSAKVSTLGLGAEVLTKITPRINARLGINTFDYDFSETESGIEYDIELQLSSCALLCDWHPFEGGFRISGGLVLNNNELEMIGRQSASATYTIDDTIYTSDQVGTLKAEIDFNDIVPYAGIGWGNAFGGDKRWGFVFGIGVVFQGSPEVSLTATGTSASDATFQAELANEKKQLEDELEDFKYYPVIALSITYKF